MWHNWEMWIQKVCNINGIQTSYWENGGDSKETIVFLPGGNTSGMHLKHLDDEINPNIRFVVSDYPGRGKSDSLAQISNFQNIATQLLSLFEYLKLKDLTLIGHSFGWAVADQVVKQNQKLNIRHLVLIDPGEFIWAPLRLPLKVFFSLPTHSQKAREFFWYVICNIFHIFEYQSIALDKLKDLGEQWTAVLNFKMPSHQSSVSTLLVRSMHDVVMDGHNIEKVKKIYPDNWEIFLPLPHIMDYEDRDGKVRKILFPAIGKEMGIDIIKKI